MGVAQTGAAGGEIVSFNDAPFALKMSKEGKRNGAAALSMA